MNQFGVLDAQNFLITDALGLVIADQIRSGINIPPLDNSAMDGYAVRSIDVSTATYQHPVMLEILETIPAGSLPRKQLRSGTASRIMTGAPIPEHCDAVIPFEETTEKEFSKPGELAEIGIRIPAFPGTNVRAKGKDIKKGDSVLLEGHIITAATVGVLASMGMSHVRAIRKPVVSVLSTGNELLTPG
ncbi:MAG TPA: molybdopterin molybdenumtransferase MoeA, partial [Dehalococcoidia bacterium]|nr:molybdopterin molybdenumtransferase MoeA [Dehalococcoidia bacterium]